jgi:hypothetical protein
LEKLDQSPHLSVRFARSAPAATTLWQREFFDHVLCSAESYGEKWNYVRDNPVRAGLVSMPDEWKFTGEIEILMR